MTVLLSAVGQEVGTPRTGGPAGHGLGTVGLLVLPAAAVVVVAVVVGQLPVAVAVIVTGWLVQCDRYYNCARWHCD